MKRDDPKDDKTVQIKRAASAWRSRIPGMRSQSYAPRLRPLRLPLPKTADDVAPMAKKLLSRVSLQDLVAAGAAALETHAAQIERAGGGLGRHHGLARRLAETAKKVRAPDLSKIDVDTILGEGKLRPIRREDVRKGVEKIKERKPKTKPTRPAPKPQPKQPAPKSPPKMDPSSKQGKDAKNKK